MKFFVAGVIVAWVVEWLLFTFWWKKKASSASGPGISVAQGAGRDDRPQSPIVTSTAQALPAAAAVSVPVAAADTVTEAPTSHAEPARAEISGEQDAESSGEAGDSPLASALTKARKTGTVLRMIAGVGPKTQELLNAAGFQTLEQVAETDPKGLKAVLDAAGPRFALIDPESWPQQARMILACDAEGLRKIQDGLKK